MPILIVVAAGGIGNVFELEDVELLIDKLVELEIIADEEITSELVSAKLLAETELV